jgi:hypothetical protein
VLVLGEASPESATVWTYEERGIELRDYFAAKSMAEFRRACGRYEDSDKIAQWAYEDADAMMRARDAKAEISSDEASPVSE